MDLCPVGGSQEDERCDWMFVLHDVLMACYNETIKGITFFSFNMTVAIPLWHGHHDNAGDQDKRHAHASEHRPGR
jgi:hypothetical protein